MARAKMRLTRGGWWPCEERVLRTMLEDQHPVYFIAEVLNRERMGVHSKIKTMQRLGQLPQGEIAE